MLEKTDAGRKDSVFEDEKNDCVVRAYALMKAIPYELAYGIIKCVAGRKARHGTKQTGYVPVFEREFKYVECSGWRVRYFLAAHKFECMILVRAHIFYAKDGVQYDMGENDKERVIGYWVRKDG